jgi:hypothetical protein
MHLSLVLDGDADATRYEPPSQFAVTKLVGRRPTSSAVVPAGALRLLGLSIRHFAGSRYAA